MSLVFIAAGLPCLKATSIDAVYFAQTHVQKADDLYPTLAGNRDTLIKAHVVDPTTPTSPAVTAILSLNGNTLNLSLSGPGTLPASILDGPGVVQHNFADSFTATIPAAWVKQGLTVEVFTGAVSSGIKTLDIGAPTKVIMTMTDIHFFELNAGDYPSGWDTELEAKWPVSALEINRADDVVFPELVMYGTSSTPSVRVTSKEDYVAQTGASFDGENSIATTWNVALRRAAGRTTGYSLYYLNKYNVSNEGVGGGFSGVGTGHSGSIGILHHELGHALSLPHWGDNAGYPYKGAMHGINYPATYKDTHSGPTWAFDLPSQSFIPCTVQADNVGDRPVGTYKGSPMQGGGTGAQEAGYLFNHFSDYGVNRMRGYLEGVVVAWNPSLNAYAKWNSADGGYTNVKANNGVNYPLERDQSVISIMAAVSGATPDISMVYPPIGPYKTGLIRLFDPTSATDRTDAQSIFAPADGCDITLRVIQGGVTKTYMLAASWDTAADPLTGAGLKTEAINLRASDGTVTKVELLLTPDAEINGIPVDPQILYTWTPANSPISGPGTFAITPMALDDTSITMTATTAIGDSDFNRDVEYLFTGTSGNFGSTNSGWQSSPIYTDTDLQPNTEYRYTVTVRSAISKATSASSNEFAATTDPTIAAETVLQSGGDDSWNAGIWTAGIPTTSIDARIAANVEGRNTTLSPTWSGQLTLDPGSSLRIDNGGEGLLDDISSLILNNATIYNTFGIVQNSPGLTWVFPPITLNDGGFIDSLGSAGARLDYFHFDDVISGTGGFTITAGQFETYNFNNTNTFTGGLVIASYSLHTIGLNSAGAAGDGNVTVLKSTTSDQSAVLKLGADNIFSPSATLRLNGKGWNNNNRYEYRLTTIILDMNSFNATVNKLYIDGVQMPTGDYTGTSGTWIDGMGILTVTGLTDLPPVVVAGAGQTVSLDAWSPGEIVTASWFDASDSTTLWSDVGGTAPALNSVARWDDKSGNDHHFKQATGSGQPVTQTRMIGGLNALDFDGSNELVTDVNPIGATINDAFLFLVTEVDTISQDATLVSLSGTDDLFAQRWNGATWTDGKIHFDTGGVGGSNRISYATGWGNGDVVQLGLYCSQIDSVQQVWIDGTSVAADATGHAVTTAGGLKLGTRIDGSVAELIVINGTVTTENQQNMEGYLAHKWGLAANLPGGHPYKNAAPGAVKLDGTVTDPEGAPMATTWIKVSGPGAMTFADGSAVDTTVTFTEVGTYVLRLTADDGSNTTLDEVTIIVTGSQASSTYTSWVNGYLATSGNSGFSHDTDNDGVSNGLEYYFGTDPTAYSQSFEIIGKVSDVVTFSHPLNSALGADVSAVYRWSEDLSAYNLDGGDNGNGTTVNFVQGTPSNGMIVVTATIAGPVPGRLFVSIEASLTP